jgi:hypothetical protein
MWLDTGDNPGFCKQGEVETCAGSSGAGKIRLDEMILTHFSC